MIGLGANCVLRKECYCPEKPSVYIATLLEITLLVCGILMLKETGPFAAFGQGCGIGFTVAGGAFFLIDAGLAVRLVRHTMAKRNREANFKKEQEELDARLNAIQVQQVPGQTYYQVDLRSLFQPLQDLKAHCYKAYSAQEVTDERLQRLSSNQFILCVARTDDLSLRHVIVKDQEGESINWDQVISDIEHGLGSIASL